ncbi:MAG: serine protease [SAR324 cluster bacterium]|nr:serine protease [SAR324 cluster bacterium]
MDNPLIFPIVLQLIGVVVLVAEILIPTGGLLGILTAALFGYSLYAIFSSVSTAMGIGFVLADLVIIPVIVVFGFKTLAKSSVTLKKRLSSAQGVNVQNRSLKDYIGKQGVAVTDLRPSGIAVIAKERLDVVTEGQYLAKDSPLIVTSVTGNQIIVEETPSQGEAL